MAASAGGTTGYPDRGRAFGQGHCSENENRTPIKGIRPSSARTSRSAASSGASTTSTSMRGHREEGPVTGDPRGAAPTWGGRNPSARSISRTSRTGSSQRRLVAWPSPSGHQAQTRHAEALRDEDPDEEAKGEDPDEEAKGAAHDARQEGQKRHRGENVRRPKHRSANVGQVGLVARRRGSARRDPSGAGDELGLVWVKTKAPWWPAQRFPSPNTTTDPRRVLLAAAQRQTDDDLSDIVAYMSLAPASRNRTSRRSSS